MIKRHSIKHLQKQQEDFECFWENLEQDFLPLSDTLPEQLVKVSLDCQRYVAIACVLE